MILAFQKAVVQLGDPRLRRVLLRSLGLAAAAYALVWALAWAAIWSFTYFEIVWLNETIRWLGGFAVTLLSLLLFPATFGAINSIFLEEIADIVEAEHYPALGKAPGVSALVGIVSGLKFFVLLVAINLLMLPFYLVAIFVAGMGLVLFYGINGWLCGNEYYEQVALRRRPAAEVKAWRKANAGRLWLTGAAIAAMGTVPFLNLFAPVIGCAMMVHVAQGLKPPPAPGRPFAPA